MLQICTFIDVFISSTLSFSQNRNHKSGQILNNGRLKRSCVRLLMTTGVGSLLGYNISLNMPESSRTEGNSKAAYGPHQLARCASIRTRWGEVADTEEVQIWRSEERGNFQPIKGTTTGQLRLGIMTQNECMVLSMDLEYLITHTQKDSWQYILKSSADKWKVRKQPTT